MATQGGERMGEAVPVPVVTRASFFIGTESLVAWFAVVHAAATLIMFVVLAEENAQHLYQCMEACPMLSIVELSSALFLHVAHETMKVYCVVQMLVAALALVSTGWFRRAASFVAVCLMVTTGTQSIRLVYTALFGTHCCFSGGIVQVAFAVAVVTGQLIIPFRAPSSFGAPPCREQ